MVGSGPKQALLEAVRAILRPLVRQLIAYGITYPAFSRVVKEVYIEVGTRHFTLDFKKQTDSRVALVTGITRKEIGQIRRGQTPSPSERVGLDETLPARVVSRWIEAPPYTAPDGRPYILPYEADDRACFVALVAELGGDIPPRAVLDELVRAGVATITPQGSVRLVARAYAPAHGVEDSLIALGRDAAAVIERGLADLERPD